MGNTANYYKNVLPLDNLHKKLSKTNYINEIYVAYIHVQPMPEGKTMIIYSIQDRVNYYFHGKKELFDFINSTQRPYVIYDGTPITGIYIHFIDDLTKVTVLERNGEKIFVGQDGQPKK